MGQSLTALLAPRLAAGLAKASTRGLGVLVAHSGGLDSTALFHLLWQNTKIGGTDRVALGHVNFGLRGAESDADEEFSRQLATSHDAAFLVERIGADERDARRGESTQEWARRVRYEIFARWAAAGWTIALAHHADDQAETVLQRIARGASPATLLGMTDWSGELWRPLLSNKKSELAAWLAGEGLAHREDSTNAKLVYSRNVIRHEVLPKLEALHPGAAERIVATARDAQETSEWVREQIRVLMRERCADLGQLARELPQTVAMVLLTEALAEAGIEHRALTRPWLATALNALRNESESAWALDVPGGGRLRGDGRTMRVERAPPRDKSVRKAQLAYALDAPKIEALLEPQSHMFIRHGARIVSVCNQQTEFLSPTNVKVYGASASKRLRFKGSRRSWKLKELMRRWRIELAGRPDHLAVSSNDELVGLFDGASLARPDEGEALCLDLRYLLP